MVKRLFISLISLLFFANTFAQGYQININISNNNSDSIYLRAYDKNKFDFVIIESYPFDKSITFKGKKSLEAGFYSITADTNEIASFFISNKNNQKFSISVDGLNFSFKNSEENIAYVKYVLDLRKINDKYKIIEDDIKNIQQSNIPRYMQQTMFDSILVRIRNLNNEKLDFQTKIIKENEDLLFASYVKTTIDLPEPPRNQNLYNKFVADTIFSSFPWQDERIFNTPFAHPYFINFARTTFYMSQEAAAISMINNLKKSRIQSRESYYYFFDFLEKEFGKLTSPYRDEKLYIPILKFALEDDQLDIARRERYIYELNLIDKNNEGDTMPDFPLLMSNGDTTSLHKIEAKNMLVYFQNPECPTCREVRGKLAQNETLKSAIANKDIVVVTVYFEKDESLWRHYLQSSADPTYLHGWNFSQEIEANSLYDTRVIPLMMLVNKDKVIIKKDIMWNDIESYVGELTNH